MAGYSSNVGSIMGIGISVLIEDADDHVTLLYGSFSEFDYLGQSYDRSDYLEFTVVLLVDNAL